MGEFAVLAPVLLLAFVLTRAADERRAADGGLLVFSSAIVSAIGFLVLGELVVRVLGGHRVVPAVAIAVPLAVWGAFRARLQPRDSLPAFVILVALAAFESVIARTSQVLLSPDSYSILANSSIFRDGVAPTLGALSEVVKRGVTIPVLHALMPRDEFLVSLAPGLCLVLAGVVIGFVHAMKSSLGRPAVWMSGLVLAGFLLVEQYQLNFFYLNSHTLVAVVVTAFVTLSLHWRDAPLDAPKLAVLSGLGIALTLARAEGYLVLAVLVLSLVALRRTTWRQLASMLGPSLLAAAVWNVYLAGQFAGSHRPLVIVAFDVAVTAGVVVANSGALLRLRERLLEVYGFVVGLAVVAIGMLHPQVFAHGLVNCAGNVYRFWTPYTAVLIVLCCVYAVVRSEQPAARHVALVAVSLALTLVFSKIFDSGIGSGTVICRPGWGDTINRSIMHLVGLMALMPVLAVFEAKGRTDTRV